jgi:hypothetical protein
VGEELDLGFTTLPPRTAASFGGLTWAIKSGGNLATLTNSGANDGVARLVMGNSAGTVVLELRTLAAPPIVPAVKATKTLWIVEPNGAAITRAPNTSLTHLQNTASAGFWGEIRIHPTDVSFYKCQMREGSAAINATGSMKVEIASTAPTSASTGQQAQSAGELNALAGARHPVMGNWVDIGTGSALGSKVTRRDNIQSIAFNPPYAIGTFDWDIAWFFRVQGTLAEKRFCTMTHHEAVDAQGNMTISKGGTVVTRQPADPTTDKNNPPPP